MPVPSQIDDGNWKTRQPMSTDYSIPFSDVGDNDTFKAKVTYRQDKLSYRALPSMSVLSTPYGPAYLTKAGDTKDIGCGLYEFVDQFSSVPVKRTEYGSFTYTLQFYESVGESNVDPSKYFYTVTFDLEEQTFSTPCEIVYEYSINSPLTPLLKPRLIMLFGRLYFVGGIPLRGTKQVAEDSQVKIYEGRIFERRTIYVNVNPALISGQ